MHQQPPYGGWPQQPPRYQQPPYPQQPPPQQYYYPQPPPVQPQRVTSVERQRGLGGIANSTHLILTIFTCGAWLLVWIPWWIVRMVVPRKRTAHHYYR